MLWRLAPRLPMPVLAFGLGASAAVARLRADPLFLN